MRPTGFRATLAASVVVACMLGANVAVSGGSATFVARPAPSALGPRLMAFQNCTQLLRRVKAEALAEVGPYGLARAAVAPSYDFAAGARTEGTLAPGGAVPAGGYSTTNDQETGVDEPDMVKTDGDLMVVLRQRPVGIEVVNVAGPTPELDSFTPLPQVFGPAGLFLVGQDVVVVGSGPPQAGPVVTGPTPYQPGTTPTSGAGEATTDAVVTSVADPQSPTVVRTFEFRGTDDGARLIGGQVLLVLSSQPQLRWQYPPGPSPAAQAAATAANRAVVGSSSLSAWLPEGTVSQGQGRLAARGRSAGDCRRTYGTPEPTGVGSLSLVSFDPTSDAPGDQLTVVGDAQDVYASATQLYVAATAWTAQPAVACPLAGPARRPVPHPPITVLPHCGPVVGRQTTELYGFDVSHPADPQYLGAGTVAGTLLGPYAMSEYDGYLRVATTTMGEPTSAPVDGGALPLQLSDNAVTVLRPQAGALVPVGSLQGLGRGEKIDSVRFSADLGYVVTDNQTGPLYVLDLADPSHPQLDGHLDLSGFSSFLQPLGGNFVLGVGQSVDADLAPQGLQLETFNVATAGQPSLVSRLNLGGYATSAAEYDPHALLWWPQDSIVVLPVDQYQDGPGATSGADVWSVSSDGTLNRVATISQPGPGPDGDPEVQRAVVVGNDLYTLSAQGVMVNELGTFAQVSWLPYASGTS